MTFTVPIAESDVTSLVTDLAAKSPLASPTLTSSPVFPTGTTAATQSAADSSTKLATTAFVTTADNLKANLASPTFTGTVTTPNGSGATDLAAFGQIPTAGSLGGPPKIVFRTSDATPITNSAAFANDDTLLWAVGANDRWVFQAFLTFTAANSGGAAATADVKTNWSVPASGTMQHGMFGIATNTFNGYGNILASGSPNAVRTAAQSSNASAMGSEALAYGLSLAGFYTGGGTAGNVVLQWAQGTSDASTLQINKNSLILAVRLA